MARRNNFLIVTLLVMVGVLIVAILSTEGPDGPRGSGPAVAGETETTGGVVRDGAATPGGVVPGSRREAEVGGENLPVPAAAGGRVRLTGRLVDAGGVGVAAVDLDYRPRSPGDPIVFELDVFDGDDLLRATTDADGRFRFDIEPGRVGRIRVDREAGVLFGSSTSRRLDVEATAAATLDLGDVPMIAAAVLRGVVVDAAGAPLAGAKVRANPGTGLLWRPGDGRPVDAATGEFELRGLESGTLRLAAACAGFVPALEELTVAAGEVREGLRLVLTRGASLAGTVVDDRLVPIAGAKVAAYRSRKSGGVEAVTLDPEEAVTTDANGYFVLTGLEGEAVRVQAWHDGHAAALEDAVAVGTGDLQLRLQRLGSISGALVDRSLQPLVGSEIVAQLTGPVGAGSGLRLFGADRRSTTTAADGTFSLDGVAPGSVRVRATGRGHLPVEKPVQLDAGQIVTYLRLFAETGAGLAVQVFGPDNQPVRGAEVVVETPRVEGGPQPGTREVRIRRRAGESGAWLDPAGGDSLGRGTTDEEGRVMIGGLPAGAAVVRATHPDFAPAREQRVALPRSGVVDALLTLRPAGFALVRVVDSGGAPRPGTPLELRPVRPDVGSPALDARSGDDGTVRVGPLLPGNYVVQLQLPPRPIDGGGGMRVVLSGGEGKDLEGATAPVEIRAGEVAEVTVSHPVLTRLHGVVRDVAGPVAGARVRLSTPESSGLPSGASARTDAEGRYELDDVEAGTWQIEWQRPDDLIAHRDGLEIPAGTPELVRDLVLTGGEVRVRVLDGAAGGAPVVGAEVSVRRPDSGDGARQATMVMVTRIDTGGGGGAAPGVSTVTMGDGRRSVNTDQDGVAVLRGVPAGSFQLRVQKEGYAPQTLDAIDVADGRQVDAGDVTLSPAGVLVGTLRGFTGAEPIRAATITLRRTDVEAAGRPRREFVQGDDFRIGELPPGTYEVNAEAVGSAPGTRPGPAQTVVVVAGEEVRVELQVR